MAIDASIPLGTQAPAPFDVSKLSDLLKFKQQNQTQNALKQILADPNSTDPATGLPNAAAIQKIMAVSPQTGLSILEKSTDLQRRQQEGQLKQEELYAPVIQQQKDAMANLLKDRVDKFGLEKAVDMSKGDYAEARKQLAAAGVPPDRLAKMPPELTPALAQNFLAGAISPEKKADVEQRDKSDARLDATEKERERHDRETEKLLGDRVTASQTNAGQKGWSLFQDESGNSYRSNANSGKTQKMGDDGEWQDVDKLPSGVRKPGTVDNLSDEDKKRADSDAEMIASYRMPPPTGMIQRTKFGQYTLDKVKQINPEYDSTQYAGKNKTVSAFDTGKQGDATKSFNVGIAHLNTLNGLVDALGNKDEKTLNKIKQGFKEEFGSDAPTNFDAAKAIVGDEIIKAIVGGGGALADRENAQNQIDRAKSPDQLKGVIETYKDLMAGQLGGLRKQYESSTGLKDFDKKLLPTTIEQLEKHGKSAAASALPDSAKAQLKDGVITTFGNGQKWTLKDGKPEQVQ